MTLQQQPTKTSCGPTCVAMLAGVPAREVIERLRSVRRPERASKRTHLTNVGEMVRLLGLYGLRIGRRLHGAPPRDGRYLLRIQHRRGRNWHWAVLCNGLLLDPAADIARVLREYERVSFYEVD